MTELYLPEHIARKKIVEDACLTGAKPSPKAVLSSPMKHVNGNPLPPFAVMFCVWVPTVTRIPTGTRAALGVRKASG